MSVYKSKETNPLQIVLEGNSATALFLMELEIMACGTTQTLSLQIKALDLLTGGLVFWFGLVCFFPYPHLPQFGFYFHFCKLETHHTEEVIIQQ